MKEIKLYKANNLVSNLIPLPGSKSESNRALLLNALCDNPGVIENLSNARDTQIMQELLHSSTNVYDARDAGTVMRFMIAYLAIMKKKVQISGTERMKKRPVGVLVNALVKIGIDISYLENTGYPPVLISGLTKQKTAIIEIDSDVSSQYVSALLMIAPRLHEGLTIKLKGEPVSTPYIAMTVSIMQHFGVNVNVIGQSYKVEPQFYTFSPFVVESDWSGASYWYAIFALSELQELRLKGLKAKSFQGDSVVAKLMEKFGVRTTFEGNTAILTKQPTAYPDQINFIKCPDLAQTFAVLCAVLGQHCSFSGLHTLKIKETDRILAIKTELQKLGADFIEDGSNWKLIPISNDKFTSLEEVVINTYDDHRMAMAFAALATKMEVRFDNAEVVNKSYPTFWQDLSSLGFKIQ